MFQTGFFETIRFARSPADLRTIYFQNSISTNNRPPDTPRSTRVCNFRFFFLFFLSFHRKNRSLKKEEKPISILSRYSRTQQSMSISRSDSLGVASPLRGEFVISYKQEPASEFSPSARE